jgi:hypothetical protein
MVLSICGPRPVVRPLLEQTFSEPIDEAPDIDRRYSLARARPRTRPAAPRPVPSPPLSAPHFLPGSTRTRLEGRVKFGRRHGVGFQATLTSPRLIRTVTRAVMRDRRRGPTGGRRLTQLPRPTQPREHPPQPPPVIANQPTRCSALTSASTTAKRRGTARSPKRRLDPDTSASPLRAGVALATRVNDVHATNHATPVRSAII